MLTRIAILAAAVLIAAVMFEPSKPAADASPVVTTNTPAAVIAIPAALPAAPAAQSTTEVAGAGFESSLSESPPLGKQMPVSLPGQPLRKAAHVAAAPVRFVRQRQPVRSAWQNRPRLLGRVFRGRR